MNKYEQHIIGKMLQSHPRNMNVWSNVTEWTKHIRFMWRGFDAVLSLTLKRYHPIIMDKIFQPNPFYAWLRRNG